MKLIAKRPCSFGGERFYIGDVIPTEYVIDPVHQEKNGVLSIIGDDSTTVDNTIVIPSPSLSIFVKNDDGQMHLEPTDEGIQDVFTVLIGKATDAETIINSMTDEDSLILLHMADSRKSVKALAKERAQELSKRNGDM